jgi:TrmH family RNA methyltransferase
VKIVASRDNPQFKFLKRLAGSARERKKAGMTLLDGSHLIAAYREAVAPPEMVAVSRSAVADPGLRAFFDSLAPAVLLQLPDPLLRELSPVKTPTGMVALVPIPAAEPTAGAAGFQVFLEDIQDPGNLGAVLRSAAAAGVERACLSRHCADPWSPKVLRAAMGAHFSLQIRQDCDLVAVARAFQGTVVATALRAGKSLFDLDLRGAVAFVVGNEGAGLSPQLQQAAREVVSIPMPGRVESLNAAAAAAVCLFERVRQRLGGGHG